MDHPQAGLRLGRVVKRRSSSAAFSLTRICLKAQKPITERTPARSNWPRAIETGSAFAKSNAQAERSVAKRKIRLDHLRNSPVAAPRSVTG
jgi:hypothetical protein